MGWHGSLLELRPELGSIDMVAKFHTQLLCQVIMSVSRPQCQQEIGQENIFSSSSGEDVFAYPTTVSGRGFGRLFDREKETVAEYSSSPVELVRPIQAPYSQWPRPEQWPMLDQRAVARQASCPDRVRQRQAWMLHCAFGWT